MQEQSTAISTWLAEQQGSMVKLLSELVNIDSGSYDKAGVDAVGARLAGFLAKQGLAVTTTPNAHFGDILRAATESARDDRGRHNILLMGHRDTVFSKGEASRRPFTVEAGRAYAQALRT
ncbi:hypothetical protein [Paramesorhizobium deserti]|uniref:hypothetical protein n=1 Tax=Paramesorhizobium deserti TaxID=1494590 RepID=UPI000AD964E7